MENLAFIGSIIDVLVGIININLVDFIEISIKSFINHLIGINLVKITKLGREIDCFSELNKYTSSHPETELACHQEKTRHFSYYSWLIQHIDNVLQEDNIFRCSKELPELPAPKYSPSVTDLEMIQRIHVMSHAWRESDQALQEATIIHREFMLEQAHMNNTSFFRI